MMGEPITNNFDALLQALALAVTAPTDEKAQQATVLAEQVAARMPELEVQRAKHQAEVILGEVPPF
ncbi:MAG: hypothetical protein U0R66_03340 [Mycobacterium sp.]